MDDLLGFVIVILGIVSAISKNKKKKQRAAGRTTAKQAAAAKKQRQWPELEKSLREWFEEPAKPEAAVPASTGSIKEITHEGVHPCDEHTSAPKQVVQPRIQTRVQVTEKPQVVLGSMQQDTHEGLHPCDEHDAVSMQDVKPLIPMDGEKPGLQLDWTGENLVKAFIMQEVLMRPGQRRRA